VQAGTPGSPGVVDSHSPTGRTRPVPWRHAIARTQKKMRRGKAPSRRAPARTRKPRLREQPLGVGVGDSFAIKRLKVPPRTRPPRDVLEIGWAAFGDMARDLAARIAERYQPDVVLGIAKGGVFVGSAVASALQAEFYPIRVEKRSRDRTGAGPRQRFPNVKGKRVLVVDDVAATGQTLEKARAQARKAKAREVQACVLVVRPGGARPEWYAVETRELVVFGWDYQLHVGGEQGGDPGAMGI
jgi:hypoxanthine phosphoribosyltransferase